MIHMMLLFAFLLFSNIGSNGEPDSTRYKWGDRVNKDTISYNLKQISQTQSETLNMLSKIEKTLKNEDETKTTENKR